MSRVALIAYALKIREKRKTNSYVRLDTHLGKSIFNVINSVLNSGKTSCYVTGSKSLTVVEVDPRPQSKVITGLIHCGRHGSKTPVRDIQTSALVGMIDIHQSPMRTSFFRVYAPTNQKFAFIVLSIYGQNDSSSTWVNFLQTKIAEQYTDKEIVEIKPVMPSSVIKQYLKKGAVQELSFTRVIKKSDRADDIANPFGLEEGVLEIIFKARNGGTISSMTDKIRKAVKAKQSIGEVFPDQFREVTADTRSVVIVKDGRPRRFNVEQLNTISKTYDITDEVGIDGDGYPSKTQLDKAAQEYIELLLKDKFYALDGA